MKQSLNPNSPPQSTPLFLVWAFSFSCPVKEPLESFQTSHVDLLRLERAFRPIRSLAIAESEDRIWNDLCIMQAREITGLEPDQIKAFSIEEVLMGFGGEEFLKENCTGCQCNVYRQPHNLDQATRQYAGCYGYLQSQYEDLDLFDRWQTRLNQWTDNSPEIAAIKSSQQGDQKLEPGCRLDRTWRISTPGQPAYLDENQIRLLLKLLKSGDEREKRLPDLSSLTSALELSLQSNVDIQFRVVPQSQIDNRQWIVPQHCSVCIHTIENWAGQCPNCGSKHPPNSQRKRHLKGDRPYWPLIRFVGLEKAKQIASNYFAKSNSSSLPSE